MEQLNAPRFLLVGVSCWILGGVSSPVSLTELEDAILYVITEENCEDRNCGVSCKIVRIVVVVEVKKFQGCSMVTEVVVESANNGS
jgi:hypothetical protein